MKSGELPVPGASGMDRLLVATYEAEQRHFWFRGFRRFVRPVLEAALQGRPQGRVLDAGCGTGNNLTLLAEYGRACGIDLNAVGLQFGRGRGHDRLVRSSAACLPFGPGTFDLVTSFDVLYCLEEPAEQAAVAEMFRVLKPGGWALVNVAALEMLRGGQSVLGGEVRRFTKDQLRRLLVGHGFEIERLTYTNAFIFPITLAVRLAQRHLGLAHQARESDLRVPPEPVNLALSGLLTLEAHLLNRFDMPFGSSVLCLARKPAGP